MKAEERTRLTLWQQRLKEWQQSGLSQAEWSKANNLNPHQLSYWKRKLNPAAGNKLIPLSIVQSDRPSVAEHAVIHLPSGIRIEVPLGQVAKLVNTLQATQ